MSGHYDYLIVGCGFSGATLAERIARELDAKVLIIDRRDHIGGNAYDHLDENGILIGRYGAHIFHTSSEKVWNYISRFTEFNTYVHRVDACWQGNYYALPLNLATINSFFGKQMTAGELPAFLDSIRVHLDSPKNAEEAVISRVGWDLYEAFYRTYTKKQWGIDPKDLDASVTLRLPIRMNSDTRYFTDPWQGIPVGGFTKVFERMLNHKNIHLALNTDYKDAMQGVRYRKLVFTGPIDVFFDYAFGRLPYRSIEFRFETLPWEHVQHMGVVNYPNDYEFTRCVEYKWLYQQQHEKTTVSRDYPCWNDDEPYYPIPSPGSSELYLKYKELADRTADTYFCGRLGTYTYYNMDQCIAQALALFENRIATEARTHQLLEAANPT
ncbi:MAG: UDP-galactopyranose mutase [Candidatus Subteraquimicrobiales bacterium]|nr:UDP-galactopyranose mutase [Candidatus Subteraquimicrobiales bacterium]